MGYSKLKRPMLTFFSGSVLSAGGFDPKENLATFKTVNYWRFLLLASTVSTHK